MHRTLAAAMEHQERRVYAGVRDDLGEEGRVEQHLRLHHAGPTERMDGRSLKRHVPVLAGRKRDGQLD